ncbi:molybdenum cofactor biosynthesis protein MoaE [Pseudopontixanthobacter vadosimaris]|uniref:molybdenum cofactor biosynthesis protein MoaE n=1 Tax=Pseudopontixanthobacter vadosimaris TaxID=2726450 RepID=UPI0014746B89
MIDARLLEKGFSAGQALAHFARANPDSGGIASFVGKVRPDGDVKALHLTHYPPLTLPGMEELARKAMERFALEGILAWHRIGFLRPGAPIVLVAAAARHRRDSLAAVDFTMDHLKSAAWFWKREKRDDGWHWIAPRGQDHADLARWD